MSGDKKALIEKVADGEILGSMPRCSKCGGGYLKWDNKKGTYIQSNTNRPILVQWIHG